MTPWPGQAPPPPPPGTPPPPPPPGPVPPPGREPVGEPTHTEMLEALRRIEEKLELIEALLQK